VKRFYQQCQYDNLVEVSVWTHSDGVSINLVIDVLSSAGKDEQVVPKGSNNYTISQLLRQSIIAVRGRC
jgi:hypothetical protein